MEVLLKNSWKPNVVDATKMLITNAIYGDLGGIRTRDTLIKSQTILATKLNASNFLCFFYPHKCLADFYKLEGLRRVFFVKKLKLCK